MQVRLLYKNTDLAVGVNLVAAAALGWLQWEAISHPVVLGWVVYMVLVSVARFVLKGRYFRSPVEAGDAGWWGTAFAVGAGLTGVGWGTAGILLYPASQLWNQVFLAFILGGMMLGAASVLAPRAEAALAFLLPTGMAPAVRLLIQDDEVHVAMGLLATVFTVAIVITTRRIHMTIDSSLNLQFENEDLVEDLKVAKERAEALNEHLEVRVQERTAELQRSTEQLRSEIQQREQVEEELLRTRKLESLGVLAGGIAHDLNNFLAVVQGNVEVGKSLLDPADPAQGTMDEIAMACDRAVFLSSQLLTFAKGGAPVRRLVWLSKVIRESVQLAR